MVRLCSKSSRSYSGRPAIAPRRKRRARGSAMASERVEELAEAVVPRATSRQGRKRGGSRHSNGHRAVAGVSRGRSTESNEPETKKPEGLTTREGLNLAGRTRPSGVLFLVQ